MGKLKKVEEDVENLTPEELADFRKWFLAYDGAVWDQQIERDVKNGKLAESSKEALAEHKAGRTKEL